MDNQPQPKVTVIGSVNMDIVIEADRLPKQGETILGEKVHFIPGGKGANQAVAAARLGAKTMMIGALGADAFGQSLRDSLAQEQVDLSGVKQTDDVHSGIASIMLTQQDNRIIVVPGANHQCLVEDVVQHQSLIEAADIVLLQFEIPIPTVERAIHLAKEKQKLVLLNPAPAHKISAESLALVDYITPNRSELHFLTEKQVDHDQELEAAMNLLLDQGPKHVITTLGSEGAAFMAQDRKLHKVPGYQVPVVDTTGAGDCFNAAFAFAIAQERTLTDAVAFAIKASALKVTKLGAQTGMPYLEEVQHFQP